MIVTTVVQEQLLMKKLFPQPTPKQGFLCWDVILLDEEH